MLSKIFKLDDLGVSIKSEVLAGLATFLTMVYIVAVNPQILTDSGMPYESVYIATCLAAAFGSALMGVLANYPIALAPGMGLNAFFTYTIVLGMGQTWQTALGCVFFSGVIFFLLSLFKLREWLVNAIPRSLKIAIAVGIGLFLAIIALTNAGIVVNSEATLVQLGSLGTPSTLLMLLTLVLMVVLHHYRVMGAIVIAMAITTLIAFLLGLVEYQGIFKKPTGLSDTVMQLDLKSVIESSLYSVVFVILFIDLFDTSGTLIAVAQKGNLLDKEGRLPRLNRALMADSSASIASSLLGTSTTSSYIESSVGIVSGGRTGLTAVVVALLFLVALFFAPLFQMIPVFATSAALFFVAILMISEVEKLDWSDMTQSAPAVITMVMMPLSYSIAEGIALGFISYVLINVLAGKFDKIPSGVYFIAALSVAIFVQSGFIG